MSCCNCEPCLDDCECDGKCDFSDCSNCANWDFEKDITHAHFHGYSYVKPSNQFFFAGIKMAQEFVLDVLKNCNGKCGWGGEA